MEVRNQNLKTYHIGFEHLPQVAQSRIVIASLERKNSLQAVKLAHASWFAIIIRQRRFKGHCQKSIFKNEFSEMTLDNGSMTTTTTTTMFYSLHFLHAC